MIYFFILIMGLFAGFLYEWFNYIFLIMILFIVSFFSFSCLLGDLGIKSNVFGVFWLDLYSLYLIFLTMWIFFIIYTLLVDYLILFGFILYVMFFFMVMLFSLIDYMFFFIMFELSMMPIFYIILKWGFNKERYVAGLYMLMYALLFSIPFTLFLLYVWGGTGSLNMDIMSYLDIYFDSFMMLIFFLFFLVKVPMFFFHFWLTKAHVEAPVFGSMYLASIMLKMGGYGIIRFFISYMFSFAVNMWIMIISLCGSLILSIYCLYEIDIKIIIAYSSIIHMGGMISGMMSEIDYSIYGSLIMMVAHGLCSSGLFYMGNLIYGIVGSRSMIMCGGLISSYSIFSFFWLMILCFNISVPPSISLFSEVLIMLGTFNLSMYIIIHFLFILFFLSCVCIYMYLMVAEGSKLSYYKFISVSDYLLISLHLLPLLLGGLFLGDLY